MMVFGNTGDRSATGVGFTRNPATGAKEFYGEFLINAQGEDVVAGIRTPQPIGELEKVMPKAYKQLREITTRLEKHYHDVQDFEFTIQDEQLYMLQTRNGKRTGYAAVRDRDRHRQREADHAEGSGAAGRSRGVVAAARAGFRSEGVEGAAGRHEGPAGVARRRLRQGRCSPPTTRWSGRVRART